jgi:hypothetical protein
LRRRRSSFASARRKSCRTRVTSLLVRRTTAKVLPSEHSDSQTRQPSRGLRLRGPGVHTSSNRTSPSIVHPSSRTEPRLWRIRARHCALIRSIHVRLRHS